MSENLSLSYDEHSHLEADNIPIRLMHAMFRTSRRAARSRAIDSASHLTTAVNAEVEAIELMKAEIPRVKFDEQALSRH